MSLPAMSRSRRAFTAITFIGMPSEASVWYSLTLRSEILSSALPPAGMLMTDGNGCDVCRVPSVDMVWLGRGRLGVAVGARPTVSGWWRRFGGKYLAFIALKV